MAAPNTATFEKLAIEIETATPGAYAKLCGFMDFNTNREAQVETVETPVDCDDESLPYQVEKDIKSITVSIEGTAVWATQNHEILMDWFYNKERKNIRIHHLAATTGQTEFESGPALLTTLPLGRTKGQKLSYGGLKIEFDGTPVRTAKV